MSRFRPVKIKDLKLSNILFDRKSNRSVLIDDYKTDGFYTVFIYDNKDTRFKRELTAHVTELLQLEIRNRK